MLKLYTAPLEGITGWAFRRIHHELFGGADKYYMPFMAPHQNGNLKNKEKADTDPVKNAGVPAVPQVLTNEAENFIFTARYVKNLGYNEINLNLGCPSPTVTTKHKGAGFLGYPEELDRFFDTVFSALDGEIAISVKSRIGLDSTEEAAAIYPIYEKYPIAELTIHPRTRRELYKGIPHRDVFEALAGKSRHQIVYNGNIYTKAMINDFENKKRAAEGLSQNVTAVMCGRGLLRNPALFREYKGGAPLSLEELKAFHDRLYGTYTELMSGAAPIIGHMKELWIYWETMMTADCRKKVKVIRKARNAVDYEAAVRAVFADCELIGTQEYPRATDHIIL